ncbi:MAG: hypothetical protein R6V33_05985 [Pelovirga sp.]
MADASKKGSIFMCHFLASLIRMQSEELVVTVDQIFKDEAVVFAPKRAAQNPVLFDLGTALESGENLPMMANIRQITGTFGLT